MAALSPMVTLPPRSLVSRWSAGSHVAGLVRVVVALLVVQLGFALARANAHMPIHADVTRRSAHNRVRISRLRSPTDSDSES